MRQVKQDAASLWWLVVFGVVWNLAFGVTDFVLVHLREPTYMAFRAWILNIPRDALVLYYDLWPAYARIGWVMNAFGGLAGSLLLLVRDRYAVWLFGVSLAGLILLSYLFYFAPFPRGAGDAWAESLDVIRNAIALVSGLHSLLVIVAVNRFITQPASY
jgi:hypothetical protein